LLKKSLLTTKKIWSLVLVFFTPERRLRLRQFLGGALLLLLIWQILREGQFERWWQTVRSVSTNPVQLAYLSLAVFLMPINWMLETAKWRTLLMHNWQASWWTTFKAVLAGISVSLATPNRIGEYGGRALLAPANQTVNVIFTSIVGSFCQWLVFLGCGWPALWLTLGSYYEWSEVLTWSVGASLPLVLLILLLLGKDETLRRSIISAAGRNRWLRWLRRKIKGRSPIAFKQFLWALFLGLLRFWVYSYQFLLLLWVFGFPLGFGRGVQGIFSIYLIQAGIPLPPGFSVITRSELALLVWGNIDFDPLAVVSATFSLYLINLLLPALLGAVLIVRKKKKS
jgi:hypothetical protein